MKEKQVLSDVYKDFFGIEMPISEEKSSKENVSDIDSLYLKEESKELLKKIINYMQKYSIEEVTNYISFNIIIETNDKKMVNNIGNILRYYSNKYNYCEGKELVEVSLYKVDKENLINEYYVSSNVISYFDLEAINMNDANYIKKLIFNLKEHLNERKINIISGKKEVLNDFLSNDESLRDNYFKFNLFGIKPSINEIYNNIINKLNIDDAFNIKILDYITTTYEKSDLDYQMYIENLCDYITFNNDVPQIDIPKSIDEIFKELNELVGLKKVKNVLNDLVNLITLKNKTKDELKINNVNLHMVFLGNPGTGKTTVARLISEILYNLKYIKQNKIIEVSSKDLIAEYVGQTAIKTMNVVNKALGGVLFIDEAYSLASKNGQNSFNDEAIATLIKAMEDYRDNLVVIFAGYTKEMQDFLNSNSGIVSRIGYTLEFEDYTNEELKQIFENMIKKAGFNLEPDAIDEVENKINENRNKKNFGNARFIRNLYEKTIINHASNTKNNKSKKILKTITKKDIKY